MVELTTLGLILHDLRGDSALSKKQLSSITNTLQEGSCILGDSDLLYFTFLTTAAVEASVRVQSDAILLVKQAGNNYRLRLVFK